MHQLLRSIAKAAALVPAFVTLVALRTARHWIDVRLMVVGFHKFGHLALEPELALLEIEAEETMREGRNPKIITWWSFGPKRLRANSYLVDKWKQVLRTKPSWWINALVRTGGMFPFLELQAPMLSIQRPMQQLSKTKSRIRFSIAECNSATKELSLFGIDPKKPFVCLVVRDDGHYGDVLLSDNPNFLSSNFDVEEFVAASRALVDRGYQVVRMGAGREKSLTDNHPGIFDYAKSEIRSPFLDVFLAANCAFAISTQTGPDAVSLLFRRPVCFIDIPIFSQFFFGTELAMWNPCTLIKDGVKISLDEIVSSEKVWAKYTHDLREQGIDGIRLTSQELTETVLAYATWYENDFAFSTDDAELIQCANDKIGAGMGAKGLVNFGQIRSRICPTYLSRNADWFLR